MCYMYNICILYIACITCILYSICYYPYCITIKTILCTINYKQSMAIILYYMWISDDYKQSMAIDYTCAYTIRVI